MGTITCGTTAYQEHCEEEEKEEGSLWSLPVADVENVVITVKNSLRGSG